MLKNARQRESRQPSVAADTGAVTLRCAQAGDVEALAALIKISAGTLSRGYYSEREIAAATANIFGVDTTLIDDGTYFVAEQTGRIAACGGWSKRRTLFGGDRYAIRDAAFSNPAADPAKIRAFFVHPDFARRGIARLLLARCEAEARAAGYASAELMSTLPGVAFYVACGYVADAPTTCAAGEGVEIQFVPMRKALRGREKSRHE